MPTTLSWGKTSAYATAMAATPVPTSSIRQPGAPNRSVSCSNGALASAARLPIRCGEYSARQVSGILPGSCGGRNRPAGNLSAVTALRPDVRRQAPAVVLGDESRPAVDDVLAADPIVNAVVAARLGAAGTLRTQRLGGVMVGVRVGGALAGACYSGGNLVPVGGDAESYEALADFVARRPRACTSIVGRAEAVAAMWPRLQRAWGPARAIRGRQPLLLLDREAGLPVGFPADEEVRAVGPHQLDRYLAAAAAMFTEELGVSPHVAPGTSPFRARMRELIATGRAFARLDFRGQVMFKAEIGAVSAHTSQIQGVWVRPDLRGRGLGTAALATVMRHALTLAPTVSLYVNDFNTPARRMYDRLGMTEHAILSTVLLA
jgi:uncharacterized protein